MRDSAKQPYPQQCVRVPPPCFLPPHLPEIRGRHSASGGCMVLLYAAVILKPSPSTVPLMRIPDTIRLWSSPLEFLCLASMITNQLLTKINSLKWGSDKVSPTRCQITRLLRPLNFSTYNILMLLGLLALKVFLTLQEPKPWAKHNCPLHKAPRLTETICCYQDS